VSERYHRSQILLEREQHKRLRQMAEREGRSISDVAREAIGIGLEALTGPAKARARRRTLALERLSAIREAARTRHGVYQGDLVAEARAEREQSHDRTRREQS
jgi:hypothetical protein